MRGATPQEQAAALAIIAPLATKAERLYGVPAEMTCAQAMIETAWGLAPIGTNWFGIKKAARHKMSAWKRTNEVLTDAQLKALKRKVVSKKLAADGKWDVVIEDEFAGYPTVEDAVKDYAWMISSAAPYAKAWEAFKKQQQDWQSLIRNVGAVYATGRGYADLVIAVASMRIVAAAIAKARQIGKPA